MSLGLPLKRTCGRVERGEREKYTCIAALVSHRIATNDESNPILGIKSDDYYCYSSQDNKSSCSWYIAPTSLIICIQTFRFDWTTSLQRQPLT